MANLKKFISNIILIAALGALAAFAASLFMVKYWQVSGRIVVFPSGKPVSASQNLSEEVGNTAWIVNSDTFQKNNFGDLADNFIGAEVVENSSIVLVKFRSRESDIESIEDLISKIPAQVDEYARDLYDGSPFKYKMVSDPEISARPVRPDVVRNSSWGFAAGAILYLLYWIIAEPFIVGKKSVTKEEAHSDAVYVPAEPISYEPIAEHEPAMSEPTPEIHPEEIEPAKPAAKIASAPDNLPIAETKPSASKTSEYREPTDEEVKERLNKLMRGEL